jgi:hypothetical protein
MVNGQKSIVKSQESNNFELWTYDSWLLTTLLVFYRDLGKTHAVVSDAGSEIIADFAFL